MSSPVAKRGWRLLDTGAHPAAWNMACDRILLDAVGRRTAPPTVRVYAWSPPAISLGRHQPDPGPAAITALVSRGLEWVRRPTGGRAVYHGPEDEELTYAVAAPIDTPALQGNLSAAYRAIHEGLAGGLRGLGASVTLAPRTRARPPRPASRLACFAASVPWEIGVEGRKLLGSAQRRSRRALLQHGSLPLAGDQAPLREAWPESLAPDSTTTLAEAIGRPVEFAEAARALSEALADRLGVTLTAGALTDEERAGIERELASARA